MKTIIVYTLTDPRDKLIKYLGVTYRPKRRLYEHLNSDENTIKGTWIKKLKSLNLKPIYDEIDVTDSDNYVWVEQYWISQLKSWGFPLKNMTDGGDGSYGVIPWNKGLVGVFKHSEESKKKMSEYRKEHTNGINNGFYGKTHSNIVKQKLSDRMKGSKWDDLRRGKLSGDNNPNSKKVYCYDLDGNLIKIYDTGISTKVDGFNPNLVSKVCRKKMLTHKGYVFSFSEICNFDKNDYVKKIWNKGLLGVNKHSSETKLLMSEMRKGKPININNNGENNPNSKVVYCYNLDGQLVKIYKYTKQVEEDGFDYGVVRKRCKKNSTKPYRGFVFSNKWL